MEYVFLGVTVTMSLMIGAWIDDIIDDFRRQNGKEESDD